MTSSSRKIFWIALGFLLLGLVGIGIARAVRSDAKDEAHKSSPSTTPSGSNGTDWFAASPTDPEAAPTTSVSGRVSEDDGSPIADATVCAWKLEGTTGGLTRAEARTPVCTQTNASGAYEIGALRSATYQIGAAARAHTPATYALAGQTNVRLADGEEKKGIDFVLHHGGVAVRGRVKDAFGGVVAGAVIAVSGEEQAPVAAQSDDKGEFTAYIGAGYVSVSASAPGYATAHGSGYAPEHFFELSCVPSSVIVGRAVVHPGGTPVAGAIIDAISLDARGRESARSGEDGTFRIEGLSPGRYRLEGLAPGLSGYARGAVLVGVAQTSNETIVELDRSPPVTAKVVDSLTKEPCTSGEVTLFDKRVNEFAQATIDKEGTAHFTAVLPGNYAVDVNCTDHARKGDYPTVAIKDAPIAGLVWEVDRGSVLSGFVVDANGKPVDHADVYADPEESKTMSRPTARTDAQGTFTMKGLAAGKYQVRASSSGGATPSTESVEVDGKRELSRVKITLGVGATLAGTVRDADGKPLGGATVSLNGASWSRAETHDDGTFTVKGLVAGDYRVSIMAESTRLKLISTTDAPPIDQQPLTIVQGEAKRADFTVEKRSGTIEGRVVDMRGEALPDFFIDAQRIDNGRRRGRTFGTPGGRVITDGMGRFRITDLGDGEYTLRAFRQSGAEGSVEHVKIGATDVVVKISAGNVAGSVATASGVRPDRFTISISGGKRGISRSEVAYHANGSFAVPEVPSGTYEISIESPEGNGSVSDVVVTDGQTANVNIKLEPPAESEDAP